MVQLDKTWVRWGIIFAIATLFIEVVMLRGPETSSIRANPEQAWVLPVLADRSQLIAISEAAAVNAAWGLMEGDDSAAQKVVSWQLKGIVKVGTNLLALIVVDNKVLRVNVGDKVLDSKIEIIQATSIAVSEIDETGESKIRTVKVHR